MEHPFIPFALPLIEAEEKEAVLKVLDSGWLTTGTQNLQFEKDFAAYVGARHAIAVNSCTAALHLALEAVGLQSGDEVITTPFTFTATAEVVRYFNAKPVFADIDPDTFNIAPQAIAKGRGTAWHPGKAKAIIPVHYGGIACDMDPILALAKENGMKVIEDAAHTLPTWYKGRKVGVLGDITCFSFYVTKTITTGEGGMITTDSDALAERMRVMRLHGINKDAWKRYTAEGNWFYEVVAPGYKYNLTDIAAALGVAQLRKADRLQARREAIAKRYDSVFADNPGLTLPPRPEAEGSTHSWHLYPLRLNPERLRITRNEFIERMRAKNIGTSVHFIPLHIQPYYRDTYGLRPEDFPHAHALYQRIVSLPIFPAMSDAMVERVAESVTEIIRGALR